VNRPMTRGEVQDETQVNDSDVAKRATGFALLDEERRKEMARSGGQASQRSDKVRRWSPEVARQMGSLGGHAARDKRRAAGQQA
jgi:general stress protein YciG